MSRSMFMAISAGFGLIYGVLGLVTPGPLQRFYGIAPDTTTMGLGQLLGASYVGYAVLNWLARDVRDVAAQRAIGLSNFAGWAISLVVGAVAVPSVTTNAAAYSIIVVQLIFTVGWAYFAFVERRSVPHPAH